MSKKEERIYKKILPIEEMSEEEKKDVVLLTISKFLYFNEQNKTDLTKYDYIKQIYKPKFMELMFCKMMESISKISEILSKCLETRIDTDVHNNGGHVFCLNKTNVFDDTVRLYYLDVYCDIDHFPEELLRLDDMRSVYKTKYNKSVKIPLLDTFIFNKELLPNFMRWRNSIIDYN